MKRDIDGYLHLYLGCEVEVHRSVTGRLVQVGIDFVRVKGTKRFTHIFQSSNVVPILRPLSSMTDEEKRNLLDLYDINTNNILPEIKTSKLTNAHFSKLNAEMTRYLLGLHFDLFGLIEDGLAIDKTKEGGGFVD